MELEQIKDRLNDCASKKSCKSCKHSFYGFPTMQCEGHMIAEMGEECRKLVEQMGDDGK